MLSTQDYYSAVLGEGVILKCVFHGTDIYQQFLHNYVIPNNGSPINLIYIIFD